MATFSARSKVLTRLDSLGMQGGAVRVALHCRKRRNSRTARFAWMMTAGSGANRSQVVQPDIYAGL